MNPDPSRSSASPQIPPSQLRVIALALIGGPLVFAVIVGILRSDGTFRAGENLPGWLPMVLAGVALALIPVALVIRSMLYRRIAGSPAEKQLALYFAGTLSCFAMLEGAMLIGIVGWLLTGAAVPCVVPSALAFAIALVSLPSDDHFESQKA